MYELNKISINPLDPSQVFISSFHSGLLNIKTGESIALLDQSNSGLESIPSGQTVRISGTAFDDDANLWVLNSIIQKPLKKFNPTTNQ